MRAAVIVDTPMPSPINKMMFFANFFSEFSREFTVLWVAAWACESIFLLFVHPYANEITPAQVVSRRI